MFELDLTYFIFLVMFLAFMKALNAVYLKPVGEAIAKRRKLIADNLDAGAACRAQANEIVSGYEKDLHDIRLKAQAIINDATTQMQQRRTAEIKRVMEEGKSRLDAAKKEIESERAGLLAALVEEEKALVRMITHKLLGGDVQLNLDSRAVERALEECR